MNEDNQRTELLRQTFTRLVYAIMNQTNDPENDIRNILAEDITGFGTGRHEIYNNSEEFIEKIFKIFRKQLPADARVNFLDLRCNLYNEIGIVHTPYEFRFTLNGVDTCTYGRRTGVFKWDNNTWRAIHWHVSESSAYLIEGESLPVGALKAHNEELKKQVEVQTEKLSRSLEELRTTQQQLIHSAKMSSLGELTAGIAHEIQNPLNFVNNFSEVNKELLAEMAEEIKKGNYEAAKVLAKHVEDNQEKINYHGKRADAIVKGMLQHSRSSSGVKEPTNLNVLADEYLRLAYHGLRAKDKSFNAALKTDFDESIGNINIIPQDVGRVILNLITNAFYAVTEKKKQQQDNLPAGQTGYEPTVSVATKKAGDKVLISVKDNGNGIPQKVLDKIFQPFFTTKPAGQGTGLGLSLSYDIITKAHGGELKMNTKEGEFAEFIISLPY